MMRGMEQILYSRFGAPRLTGRAGALEQTIRIGCRVRAL